jgi:hypothetical protein
VPQATDRQEFLNRSPLICTTTVKLGVQLIGCRTGTKRYAARDYRMSESWNPSALLALTRWQVFEEMLSPRAIPNISLRLIGS